jgi:hypothetical protein
MTYCSAPADKEAVLHVRQLTAVELEEAQRARRFFKESAWDEWRTTQPLQFEGLNQQFVVYEDFSTDLVSVPGVFSWFIPRAGRYARAAVLHDYLWQCGDGIGVDHKQADTRFRVQMQRDGVSLLRRWIMWATVRTLSVAKGKGGKRWPLDLAGALALLVFVALPIVVLPVITIAVSTVVFWVLESLVALVMPDEAQVSIQLKT